MVRRLIGTQKAPEIVAYRHDLDSVAPEGGPSLREVLGRNNQDALGWLPELALRGTSNHQVIQVLPDPLEGAVRPSVICVPGLGDAGVGLPQFTDDWEDSQPIRHHRQWVSLEHYLLSEKEVTRPVTLPDIQHGPVALSVEYEQCATGPLKPHRP